MSQARGTEEGVATVWYITHEIYAQILDMMADRQYPTEADAEAAIRKKFGLRAGTAYKLVIETEDERRKRSLRKIFGYDPLAATPSPNLPTSQDERER